MFIVLFKSQVFPWCIVYVLAMAFLIWISPYLPNSSSQYFMVISDNYSFTAFNSNNNNIFS